MAVIRMGLWGSRFKPRGSNAKYPEIDEGNLEFVDRGNGSVVVYHATHHAVEDVTFVGTDIWFNVPQRNNRQTYCYYYGTIASDTSIMRGHYLISDTRGTGSRLTPQSGDGDWVPTYPPPQIGG
jgi:ornithine carbamoyltransferase